MKSLSNLAFHFCVAHSADFISHHFSTVPVFQIVGSI